MVEHHNDAELIRECQRGDQEAYAVLVEKYQERAFWVAYNMISDQDEARDVVQEAFVRIFRAIDRFDFNMSFYTWLYRIVSNLCIDHLRKARRRRPVSLDAVDEKSGEDPDREAPSAGIEESEMKREVHEVLNELPAQYKIVLVLRDLEGMSCKEIAAVTNTSHPTVRWRLHTARKQFKERWIRRQGRSSRRSGGGAVAEQDLRSDQ